MKVYRYVLLLSCLGFFFSQASSAITLYQTSCFVQPPEILLWQPRCPFDFSILNPKSSSVQKLLRIQKDNLKKAPLLKQEIQAKELFIQQTLKANNLDPNELRKLMKEKLSLESELQHRSLDFLEAIKGLSAKDKKLLINQQQSCPVENQIKSIG